MSESAFTTVGILGGGQLARMLAISGAPLGLRFLVLDNAPDACASQFVPMVLGDYTDEKALEDFVRQIDVATFDFENVPAESARWLMERKPVYPKPRALAVAQDRLAEKTLFTEQGIPVPPFVDVTSRESLVAAIDVVGLPCIMKTRRLGYDGKGQFRIKSRDDIDAAWNALGAQVERTGLIVEGFVDFDRELSVVGVRSANGEFRTWPLTENWHVDGVLSASLAPALVTDELATKATSYARSLAEALDYVGVFALELFCKGDELLANELAPRVHNSGHWTIEGAETSQFENHLRAVIERPLGSTACVGVSCMLNWISKMPEADPILSVPGGHWHDYGKSPREGRKVGHATIRRDSVPELISALKQVAGALGREAQIEPVLVRLRAYA